MFHEASLLKGNAVGNTVNDVEQLADTLTLKVEFSGREV